MTSNDSVSSLAEAGNEDNNHNPGLDSPPSRKQRCYSGCTICRARKVKCDERTGGCSNCERLGLRCPGLDLGSSLPVRDLRLPPQAGIKRKKTYRSCVQCRTAKTRCSGDRPDCTRCKRKHVECVYDSGPDPAWARAVFQSSSVPDETASVEAQQGPAEPSLDQSNEHGGHVNSVHLGLEDIDKKKPPILPNPESTQESYSWLYSPQLPDKDRMYRLTESYFTHLHPLKCFGFIHKPSFMQNLDEIISFSRPKGALIYAVCALGAKFLAFDYGNMISSEEILAAGNGWAKEASRLIFDDLDKASVEKSMAAVLLHDHELRVGRFASAFMLSGTIVRMAQALQMNVEYSTDVLCTDPSNGPSPAVREARRRLMWSCYVMDAWISSGVDQLGLIDDVDLKLQLPCSERHFTRETPAITETLDPGNVLKFLDRESLMFQPTENMGMAAYLVRLIAHRKRVLRFVKHLDAVQPPWLVDSEFSRLDRDLRGWADTLPPTLQFTTNALYIRKDSFQHSALCHLHCTYYQTMCDLYRIGMPRLFKIRTKIHYPPEKLDFLAHVQHTCFQSARQIASVLHTAIGYGIKTLTDPWLAVIAHDSNRVMLYYLTKVIDQSSAESRMTMNETLPLVRSNLEVLKAMNPLFSMSNSLYEASANMVRQSGFAGLTGKGIQSAVGNELSSTIERPTAPGTPVQATPEYVLNPLAIYRLARKNVPEREKHAPELISSPEEQHHPGSQSSSNWTQGNAIPYPGQSYPASSYVNNAHNVPFCNTQQYTGSESSDLDVFFSSDFDTTWQPADTILESSQWGGIAPWESQSQARAGVGPGGWDVFLSNYSW